MSTADQVRDKAQEGAEQAKGRLRTEVEQRSTQAGEQIQTQVSDVRTVAEELRNQGKEGPAKVAEQAAERAERLGGYLAESDADRILGDIEDYARQNPWAVAAGGLALGFLASRFVKASTDARSAQVGGAGGSTATGGATRRQIPAQAYEPGSTDHRTPATTPAAPPESSTPPPSAHPVGTPASPAVPVPPPAGPGPL